MGAGISILGTFLKALQVILIISEAEKRSGSWWVFSSKVSPFYSHDVFVLATFLSQGISFANWEEATGS